MKKILVFDDEEKASKGFKETIESVEAVKSEFEVERLTDDEFKNEMEILNERRKRVREKKNWSIGNAKLDDTSIFVIDYDLIKSKVGLDLTSDRVAYIVRSFSSCGLIVGLNRRPFRGNVFDLTLRGVPESFADINIGDKQLDNPGLWGKKRDDFRPWYWPNLPLQLSKFELMVKEVESDPNKKIFEVMGLSEESTRTIPRKLGDFLGKEPIDITFREFALDSNNALHFKDKHENDSILARVAAARVSKWIEKLLLPGQNVIVDAPHLVSRYPSLINNNEISFWAKLTNLEDIAEDVLKNELIQNYKVKKSHWFSRPVWQWECIRLEEKIPEIKEPWRFESPEWVFCEDSSRFVEDDYKEFEASVSSPYKRRYVENLQGVDYRPIKRIFG